MLIDSLLCLVCHNSQESVNHLLLQCSVADQVWSRVAHWLHFDLSVFSSFRDVMDWVDSRPTVHMERQLLSRCSWWSYGCFGRFVILYFLVAINLEKIDCLILLWIFLFVGFRFGILRLGLTG